MGENSLMYIFSEMDHNPSTSELAEWEAKFNAIELATVRKFKSPVTGAKTTYTIGARCITLPILPKKADSSV